MMKKAVKVILTTAMICLTTVSATAAVNGKITIHEAVSGQRYSIYRLFDLESSGDDSLEKAYVYKLDPAWVPFFAEGEPGGNYVEIDDSGYVTIREDIDIQTFAREALAYARGVPGISPVQSQTAGSDEVIFSGLDAGYYLIDSTVGTLCELNSTDSEIDVLEKNKQPTVEKQVREGEEFDHVNDAGIGDTVTYQTTIHATEGAQNYILHDTMGKGLELDIASIAVKKTAGDGSETELVLRQDYRVQAGREADDPCTFEIIFSQIFCDELRDGDQITVTYECTVTPDAVIEGEGNPNCTFLSYGEGNLATVMDMTTTYVMGINVFKHNTAGLALPGAVFTMSNREDPATDLRFVRNKTTGVYRVASLSESDAAAEMTTDREGRLYIEGLDAGVYYLQEAKAPAGYKPLRDPVTITVSREGNSARISYEYDGEVITAPDTAPKTVDVENSAGMELPVTGGIGAALFYVAGTLMFAIGMLFMFLLRNRHIRI